MPEVQITNPSGGILGGDRLEMDVSVASGALATVLTQAVNKAYRGAESSQHAVFRVEDGAFLEYLPHHLIPYPNSDYRQTTLFHLAPDALIAWDAFSAGRVARREVRVHPPPRPDGDPQKRHPGSSGRLRSPRWRGTVRRILLCGHGLRPGPAGSLTPRGRPAPPPRWCRRHVRCSHFRQRPRSGSVRGQVLATGARPLYAALKRLV